MVSLYIGIDPSINSTGICIQSYYNGEPLKTKFFIVHSGRLTKKESTAVDSLDGLVDVVEYNKIDTSIYKKKDNSEFEIAKTKNLISIVSSISDILDTETRALRLEYPLDDVESYITIEANSFNSRSRSVSLIELCGLNFLIRKAMMERHLSHLIVGTPSEMKKYATSKGNADKELVKLVFLTKYPELKDCALKIDDIADAYFMSCYSYKIANGVENGYVRENGLEDTVKTGSEEMRTRKSKSSETKKAKKQEKQLVDNKLDKKDLESII